MPDEGTGCAAFGANNAVIRAYGFECICWILRLSFVVENTWFIGIWPAFYNP